MTADGVDPIPDEVLAGLVRRRVTVGMTLGIEAGAGRRAAARHGRPDARPGRQRPHGWSRRGVHMIAGTDAGIAPIKPPDVIRWAVAQFQLIGLTAGRGPARVHRPGGGGAGPGRPQGPARGRATTPTSSPSTATRSPTPPRCIASARSTCAAPPLASPASRRHGLRTSS